MGKKKNKYLESKLSPILKDVLKRAENDFMKCARRINKEIHKDVKDMYLTFIEQFYEYRTTSYLRHFEPRVGTGKGENLTYPAEGIRINNQASHSPKLYIEFWADEMAGGYRFDTPEHVLDCVIHGIRFPYATGESGPMMANTTFSYKGKYFSYTGDTIQEAFDIFDKNWDDISSDAFYSIWDEYVSKWEF